MNIVVIGVGRYAKSVHIPYIKNSANAELVGLVDPNLNSNPWEVPHCLDPNNLIKFLTDQEADGVIVSTSPEERGPIYDQLTSLPVHIHLDKPILSPRNNQSRQSYLDDLNSCFTLLQNHQLPVSIHSQRRYDQAINSIANELLHVYQRTGLLPHKTTYRGSDGDLRTSEEWEADHHHALRQPTGIITHSFYHYIDTYAYLINTLSLEPELDEIYVQPTYLSNTQNQRCTNALLNQRSNSCSTGPIGVEATYTFRTNDTEFELRISLSHRGATVRSTQEITKSCSHRFSQKHLHISASSAFSADYHSRPASLKEPHTKKDWLALDNVIRDTSMRKERERKNRLDEKRCRCLQDFVQTFVEGRHNKSSIQKHRLTHTMFFSTIKELPW